MPTLPCHTQVRIVQRAFVEEMLRSSNFSKLLSAARECLRLVERANEIASLDNSESLQVGRFHAPGPAKSGRRCWNGELRCCWAAMNRCGRGHHYHNYRGLLSRAQPPAPLQDTVAWMDAHDVLRKMLRANLHQRQYAELVSGRRAHALSLVCTSACRCTKRVQASPR